MVTAVTRRPTSPPYLASVTVRGSLPDLVARTGGAAVHAERMVRYAEVTSRTDAHVVVLVEGRSDQRAVETLAARRGRDLAAEGVLVVPMGGATNLRHALGEVHLARGAVRVAGLCDSAEEGFVRRVLRSFGMGPTADGDTLATWGFFVCDADLEDELIRAVGTAGVESILAAESDLLSFRRFQRQPAHRGRPVDRQLHRFLGTRAGRKARYAALLADALDLARVPTPLGALLRATQAPFGGLPPFAACRATTRSGGAVSMAVEHHETGPLEV